MLGVNMYINEIEIFLMLSFSPCFSTCSPSYLSPFIAPAAALYLAPRLGQTQKPVKAARAAQALEAKPA